MSASNIIVLIGCLQGLSLCLFSWKNGKRNLGAYVPFCLFIGSLTTFNLFYLLIYNEVWAVSLFPIPYKYLIGVGFFIFLQSHLNQQKEYFPRWVYLFFPAIAYALLRLYWWVLSLTTEPDVIRQVYDTGFFTVNEFVYLVFNLVLGWFAIDSLRKTRKGEARSRAIRKLNWLRRFSLLFVSYTLLHLLLTIFFVVNGSFEDSFLNYYLILFINSIYLYYLGYLGFTNQQEIFTRIHFSKSTKPQSQSFNAIDRVMRAEGLFREPSLTVAVVSVKTNIPVNQITEAIAEKGMNFSEYVNMLRVEEVKRLIRSGKHQNLKLEALAREAGFNSKTTFNTAFKAFAGMTPSAYVREKKG